MLQLQSKIDASYDDLAKLSAKMKNQAAVKKRLDICIMSMMYIRDLLQKT